MNFFITPHEEIEPQVKASYLSVNNGLNKDEDSLILAIFKI